MGYSAPPCLLPGLRLIVLSGDSYIEGAGVSIVAMQMVEFCHEGQQNYMSQSGILISSQLGLCDYGSTVEAHFNEVIQVQWFSA